MFKEMCKVTEIDCFEFWQLKIIEKTTSVRKKKRPSNTLFERKNQEEEGPDFGIITQTLSLTHIDY
jgi:hypothetical protein